MINIILCGGSGTRLWPLSRTMLPKQFVRLFEDKSLFQTTALRNAYLCESAMVVSNTEQYFLAVDQLNEIGITNSNFLLEPIGRNTAPAIALACMAIDPDEIVLVTSSDHLIKDSLAYNTAVQKAFELAKQDYIVTFGIKPEYPETGFGYIEASGNDVLSFKEKPDLETAKNYMDHGNFLWNSGIFCFKAGKFLEELKKFNSEMFDACVKALPEQDNHAVLRIDLEAMKNIPEDSIDYAVMEKSKSVKIVHCDMGWSDLGSFDSLFDEVRTDQHNNVVLPIIDSSPNPICIDSNNNFLVTSERQIALVDVNDLIVVDTSDSILISQKGSSQKVKNVVFEIKKNKPELAEIHKLAYRPWGTYEVLIDKEGHKVKRIVVKPGGRLSLQKHFHRNEHWIIVSGSATVTVDEETMLLRPNESTYIKMGQVHRLENDGKIDLVMIEVQVGEYTGEDDIVRIEDIYSRN